MTSPVIIGDATLLQMDEKYLRLARFYGVDSRDSLIEAQARHIEKLQARLPPLLDTQPGRVREG